MTATTVSKFDDVIDSRDVIARIEELEGQTKEIPHHDDDCPADCASDACTVEVLDLDNDEAEELKILKALAEEASGYASDWSYGETLIRDSYFKKYAEELADDLGMIDSDAKWPMTCIDWERAARELQQDYTAVEFDDVTYWIR